MKILGWIFIILGLLKLIESFLYRKINHPLKTFVVIFFSLIVVVGGSYFISIPSTSNSEKRALKNAQGVDTKSELDNESSKSDNSTSIENYPYMTEEDTLFAKNVSQSKNMDYQSKLKSDSNDNNTLVIYDITGYRLYEWTDAVYADILSQIQIRHMTDRFSTFVIESNFDKYTFSSEDINNLNRDILTKISKSNPSDSSDLWSENVEPFSVHIDKDTSSEN